MATFYQGVTFATTEQVTNTKLHNLVANASISGIVVGDITNGFISSLPSAAGAIPPQNLWSMITVATNASVPNVGVGTSFKLYASTYMTIASFSNARIGQQFTIIGQQASFPGILDTGNFKLSANWAPGKQYDNLTLIWDGSAFIEVGRTAT